MKLDDKLFNDLYWDEDEAYYYLPRIKGLVEQRRVAEIEKGPRHPKKISADISEQIDTLHEYQFTYQASRHEKWWLLDSLGPFFDEQWFDDVLKIVKGGKGYTDRVLYAISGRTTSIARVGLDWMQMDLKSSKKGNYVQSIVELPTGTS
jgi:hypothetical protein